jgi:hypothetical protein
MISQIAQCIWFLTKAFIFPFFLILLLKAYFCGALGTENLKAYLFLILFYPKEKQVINLDQDVHVCGYFWWMVYELLFMDHLSIILFLGYGLSFSFSLSLSLNTFGPSCVQLFFFIMLPWACPFYFFLHSPYPFDNFGESGHEIT